MKKITFIILLAIILFILIMLGVKSIEFPFDSQDYDKRFNIYNVSNLTVENINMETINGSHYYMVDNHNNSIDLWQIGHEVQHMIDDAMIHTTNLTITSSGGVVTADIANEQYPSHNIAYVVDHVNYRIIEGSGDDTVTLTKGTYVSPTTNYIYVNGEQVLKASTSFPSGEFAWAGIVEIANATDDTVVHYAVQDEVPVLYELIVNSYERDWYDNPVYETGISIDMNLATGTFSTAAGSLRFASTSVPFEARNTSKETKFNYPDDPDGAFMVYENLTGITKYQDGGSIGVNKYFKFMVYGLVEDNNNDYYYLTIQNEPSTECTSVSCAESDATHKMNYQFPDRFKRTGFRIAEIVAQHTVAGNVPQIQSNGLLYKQLLDESLVVFGGTSSIALGLDEVLSNNPNTDKNIISTANATFYGVTLNGILNASQLVITPNITSEDGTLEIESNLDNTGYNITTEFINKVKFNRTIESGNNRAILNMYIG